jgi:hypothetical protein
MCKTHSKPGGAALARVLRQDRRFRSLGMTIHELIMALAIGSIAFVSLYSGIAHGFGSVERARYKLRATQILLERFEVIRLYNWSQVNEPGFVPQTFTETYAGVTYQGSVTVMASDVHPAYTNTMRMVVGEITWAIRGSTNQQRMETFISEHGVQNYLY